jgi:branched-chain amino acid transport system permease protein
MVILLDGVVYASILFLIAVGLTFIYGVLRIVNVAHGSLYALGAYTAVSLVSAFLDAGGNPYLTYPLLVAAALLVGVVVGPVLERVFLRPFYGREEVVQLLVTFSVFLVLEDAMKLIWGVRSVYVDTPYKLLGQVNLAGISYSVYQLLLVGVALATGALLSFLINGTRFGKLVVSVISDREMSAALGINVDRVFTSAFTLGAVFAALGGAVVAPTIAIQPGVSVEVIVLAFAVVVIGGLGSLRGAALGALIVGMARTAAVYWLPEVELAVIYLIMVAILLIRPQGLFGELALRRI